jgi:phospholipase C
MAIGAARAASPVHRPTAAQARLVDDALAVAASSQAQLSDIKHVVILMQENLSFDHYFVMLSGVRGLTDPAVPTQTVSGKSYPIFDQFGYQAGTGAEASGYLQPFRLLSDPPLEDGQTTNDIGHSWAVQHQSWNGGALDSFVRATPAQTACRTARSRWATSPART